MKGRRLIISDIHGRSRALREVLERADYRDGCDTLYSVGDFCDRGRGNLETIEYLMSLSSFRPVLGNHDAWLQDYLKNGTEDENWLYNNGGIRTLDEIRNLPDSRKKEISSWLDRIPYVICGRSFLIVHGGPALFGKVANLKRKTHPRDWKETPDFRLVPPELWDRDYLSSAMLWEKAREEGREWEDYRFEVEEKVRAWGSRCDYMSRDPLNTSRTLFVGHSIVGDRPFTSEKYHICALDTGAASPEGYLTVMDIDTRRYWQSDRIDTIEEI